MYHTTDTFVLVNLDKHVVLVALFVVFITLLHFYFTLTDTGHEMQFSIESFFSKCDHIRSFLRIWSYEKLG